MAQGHVTRKLAAILAADEVRYSRVTDYRNEVSERQDQSRHREPYAGAAWILSARPVRTRTMRVPSGSKPFQARNPRRGQSDRRTDRSGVHHRAANDADKDGQHRDRKAVVGARWMCGR